MDFPSHPEAGRLIRKERLAKGWTQKYLAEKVGTNQGHIAKIESGTYNAKGSTYALIFQALDIKFVMKDASYDVNSKIELLVQSISNKIDKIMKRLQIKN